MQFVSLNLQFLLSSGDDARHEDLHDIFILRISYQNTLVAKLTS